MFAFTTPEGSEAIHDEMVEIEERIFQGLGLPYRVVDICTGDLGGAAYRKYDLEAWMPGRNDFGEVTSTSNTTDYQARRLAIRYRKEVDRPQLLHTLNGTALAISRALIAPSRDLPARGRLRHPPGSPRPLRRQGDPASRSVIGPRQRILTE